MLFAVFRDTPTTGGWEAYAGVMKGPASTRPGGTVNGDRLIRCRICGLVDPFPDTLGQLSTTSSRQLGSESLSQQNPGRFSGWSLIQGGLRLQPVPSGPWNGSQSG